MALVQQHADCDREDNLARGAAALEEAAGRGARLVAYPELAFSRFLPQVPATDEALAQAEPVPGPTTERFCALAKKLGVVVVLNLFEQDGDRTFDTSPVINADGRLGQNSLNPANKLSKILAAIAPVHFLQDIIITALERDMEMRH